MKIREAVAEPISRLLSATSFDRDIASISFIHNSSFLMVICNGLTGINVAVAIVTLHGKLDGSWERNQVIVGIYKRECTLL